MTDSVLIIGSGGREHALAWKLAQSANVKHIYVAPGNAGTNSNGNISNCNINIKNHDEISKWCQNNQIKLVVVGPEDPLADGLADHLKQSGIKCFGPCKIPAQIEASKEFAKQFMDCYQIPTARWKSFTNAKEAKEHILNAPYDALVIKASGLAAGKGVIVARNKEEAAQAVDTLKQDKGLSAASKVIVVEELLCGEEVSVLCFSDGQNISVMPPAQDHKRLLEEDEGPNTGGMGAYCRCPLVTQEELNLTTHEILKKTIDGMRSRGHPYVGVLYAGLMMTRDGPKVLEFNCRFGDPETQAILPLLKTDLLQIMLACVEGTLNEIRIEWSKDQNTVGVVLVSGGYPGSYPKGKVITCLNSSSECLIFHAGTSIDSGEVVTSGGRVLAVVAVKFSLQEAAKVALETCKTIDFEGKFYRSDIAQKALKRSYTQGMTYKSAGVDIDSANDLVKKIKTLTKQTVRSEVCGGIGGFGGIFELSSYEDPYLVAKVSNIGDKLKVAQECSMYESAGYDLVATAVNELLCHGAEPLFFLDTYTCGKLDTEVAAKVISGIAKGCKDSNCTLIGGETAEMPGMYADGDFDLTAFARGAVEKPQLLPRKKDICEGDVVVGLLSPTLSCSGFNILKKLINKLDLTYSSTAPFDDSQTLAKVLLHSATIYVQDLLPLFKKVHVKAAAYLIKDGLKNTIEELIPANHTLVLDAKKWTFPSVYDWIAKNAYISEQEMVRNFNFGIDFLLIAEQKASEEIISHLNSLGRKVASIGFIQRCKSDLEKVQLLNFNILEESGEFNERTEIITSSKGSLHKKVQHLQQFTSLKEIEMFVSTDRNKLNIKNVVCTSIEREDKIDILNKMTMLMKTTIRSGFGKDSACDLFDLKASGYKCPLLVSGSDGVGTKLKIAQVYNKHDTIGIDLVAMCANDILTHGAEPLFFLQSFYCGCLDANTALSVISGIAEGCRQANCALIGSEISELPDIYFNHEQCIQNFQNYDVVGYAEGALEKENLLPRLNDIKEDDAVIGIASSGVHSNGYSLVRKIVEVKNYRYQDVFPLDKSMTLGEALLIPTKMYVRSLLPLMKNKYIKAAAHITGGGLSENIPRVLPPTFKVVLDGNQWKLPPILQWIAEEGQLSEKEMLKTFNCGIGMALIIDKKYEDAVISSLKESGEEVATIGCVKLLYEGDERLEIKNFRLPEIPSTEKVDQKKRVGVLISGSGTNLQALIDYTENPSNISRAKIVLVISNVPEVEGLKRAKKAGIPTKVLSHKGYKKRVDFDMSVHALLKEEKVQIVCLAGFMRILSKEFVELWQGNLLNVHPALLPAFKGMNAHKQVLEAGAKVTGCTVHFVEPEVDAGAIIQQATVRVSPEDDEKTLQEKVKILEHSIFPTALELLASGRVSRSIDGKLQWHS